MTDIKAIRDALSAETTPGTWDKWQTWLAGLCDRLNELEALAGESVVYAGALGEAKRRAEAAEGLCVELLDRYDHLCDISDTLNDWPKYKCKQVEAMKERGNDDNGT